MFNEKIINEFVAPKNLYDMKNADVNTTYKSGKCGDVIKLYLKIENDVITDISYKILGSTVAIAVTSFMSEKIKGKSIQDALNYSNKEAVEYFENISKERIHCTLLLHNALVEAIKKYRKKQAKLLKK